VVDADRFLAAGKQDGMLTDNRAATDGMQAQLAVAAFLPDLGTVTGVLELMVQGLIDGLGNHQGGAGGGIDLLAVMGLDDFNVETGVEDCGCFLGQTDQDIDPQRHIGRDKDRTLGGQLRQFTFLGILQAGGADDGRLFRLADQFKQIRQGRRVGKINDDVEFDITSLGLGKNREGLAHRLVQVAARNNDQIRALFDQTSDDLAHAAIATIQENTDSHASLPRFKSIDNLPGPGE